MALTTSSTQLGCGRDIDQVWDHLAQAPDAHEQDCPYCQAARADLTGLAAATAAMRDDDATNPDLEPSTSVLDRILDVARAEVRRGRRLPLDQPGLDQTSLNTVSEQAVTAVIWRTGDRTPNVQVRRCTLTPANPSTDAEPHDSINVHARVDAPGAVAVALRVSVAHSLDIAETSSQLRDDVIDAVEHQVGLQVVSVDITVEDLHDA